MTNYEPVDPKTSDETVRELQHYFAEQSARLFSERYAEYRKRGGTLSREDLEMCWLWRYPVESPYVYDAKVVGKSFSLGVLLGAVLALGSAFLITLL